MVLSFEDNTPGRGYTQPTPPIVPCRKGRTSKEQYTHSHTVTHTQKYTPTHTHTHTQTHTHTHTCHTSFVLQEKGDKSPLGSSSFSICRTNHNTGTQSPRKCNKCSSVLLPSHTTLPSVDWVWSLPAFNFRFLRFDNLGRISPLRTWKSARRHATRCQSCYKLSNCFAVSSGTWSKVLTTTLQVFTKWSICQELLPKFFLCTCP